MLYSDIPTITFGRSIKDNKLSEECLLYEIDCCWIIAETQMQHIGMPH